LGVRGPFGNGFKPVENSILIGGGCGNAPLKYLALSLLECNYSFRWLAAARTAADLPFRELFAGENFWNPLTEDGSTGEPGRATDPLEALLSEEKPACIYASGPEPMLLAVRETALMYDVPVQLSFERYMKCAIGICGQCCLDGSGLRLCIEGPVLTEKEMCGVTEWGLSHRRASGRRP
jgi:dihydroorotate dehydrogenase electron transfer subunit